METMESAQPTLDLRPRRLPRACAAWPALGGICKSIPSDFEVEEVPAYLPEGTGEHLYLWVEKQDLTTPECARRLARAWGIDVRDIGYAGQKDRHAVTRQWFSLPVKSNEPVDPTPLQTLPPGAALRLLQVTRHRNRLRVGHVRGNRFRLVIREARSGAIADARSMLQHLVADGLPNFYDAQRFGRAGDNAELGAALLGLGTHPDRRRADPTTKRMALSALQSEVFNRVLAQRWTDGTWSRAIEGDALRKRLTGGSFTCTDPGADQPRLDAGELDVTGPMPGPDEHPPARGEARALEDRVLESMGLSRTAFERGGKSTVGARRPLRVPVTDAAVEALDDTTLQLTFSLPAGSYATRVVAELTGGDSDGGTEESEG